MRELSGLEGIAILSSSFLEGWFPTPRYLDDHFDSKGLLDPAFTATTTIFAVVVVECSGIYRNWQLFSW